MRRLFWVFLFFLYFIGFSINCKYVLAEVLINEFSVQPSDKYDWVELYAIETTDVSGWTLSDGEDQSVFETFPQGTTLNAGEYKVIIQYQRLDNDGDQIYLKNSLDVIQDSIAYGGSDQVCIPSSSESIARIPDGGNTYDRVSTPTKGSSNNSAVLAACPTPTPTPTNTPANTPVPTNTPIPTNTPAPTSTVKSTATPTKKPTLTPTPKDLTALNKKLQEEADLAEFRYNNDEDGGGEKVLGATGVSEDSSERADKISPFVYVLFGLGLIFIGVSVFLFVRNRKKGLQIANG